MSAESNLSFAEMIAAEEAKRKAPPTNNEVQVETVNDEKKDLKFYKENWWRRAKEALAGKELTELRRKHLGYLYGTYIPSDEEIAQMEADEGFYTSSIYLEKRAQELAAFVDSHEMIYQPTTAEALKRITPYAERIQQHASELLAIANEQDWENDREKVVSDLVEFLVEMFDAGQMPNIVKLNFWGSKEGHYDEVKDEVGYRRVLRSRLWPLVNRINTLAHEVWHKHQFQANVLEYQENYRYYIEDKVDYDAYRDQLVEKEAFMMGEIVAYIFRMAYLKARPAMLEEFVAEYKKWIQGDYSFIKKNRQFDAEWLCAANDIVQGFEKIEDWGGYGYTTVRKKKVKK